MLLTRDLGSLQTALCLLPVASFKSPLSLYKELVHIWHAGFYTAARDTHFDFLALVNNRDCVCFHRTAENTTEILNLLFPWALDKGSKEKYPFPSASLQEIYLHTLKTAVKCSGLVHWEDPEESGGKGCGRDDQDGEYM